ncbi:MAG TPA: hypothetical protein DEG55_01755 [Acidaminococcaceae bacterium]|nr:hypothetical protein [Acidaminococcaceae bacterium]
MKKIILFLISVAMLLSCATAFAKWEDRDIVERIRAVGNTPAAQKKADRIFDQQMKEAGRRGANRRPVVAIVYENNAKTKYDKTIDKKLFEYLDAALPVRTYELIDGRTCKEKLAEIGIEDIADAERSDIIDALTDSGVDYFLYLGVNPVQVKDKGSLLAAGKIANTSLPFRIVDINHNRYVYTKTYTESAKSMSAFGGVGSKSVTLEIITRVGKQIQDVIETRLPKTVKNGEDNYAQAY